MKYKHGVDVEEVATGTGGVVESGILPVYVGTAAVNLAINPKVNEAILCLTQAQALECFGYSSDYENSTLSEAIKAHFTLFGKGPIVMINVLDPKKHISDELTGDLKNGLKGKFVLEKKGVIKETVTIDTKVEGIDYFLTFNEKEYLVITFTDETITTTAIKYKTLDPSKVTTDEIIGGIDASGNKTGLELINDVYPKYRLVPTLIVAPKFSTDIEVAMIMETKARTLSGGFKAEALVDIPTDISKISVYTDVPGYKNDNNLISPHMTLFYPKIGLNDEQYHMSTQAAAIIQDLYTQSGVPNLSPSNKNFKGNAAVLSNGKSLRLTKDEADYLDKNGIITALNFAKGWTLWGNFTSIYPTSTDIKDCYLANRTMGDYINNTLITSFFSKVDDPTDDILIRYVTSSANAWLSSLVNNKKLVGARCEFLPEDNNTEDLSNGNMTWTISLAYTTPGKSLTFKIRVDKNYYSTLVTQ